MKGLRPVRAGGGVVFRPTEDSCAVLVVHRPRYDDWSFPKGKARAGEKEESCALREVEEETGLRCTPGPELRSTTYLDRKGRTKTVRYWAMKPLDGEFAPGDEVDEIRWLSPAQAAELLSYERDRALLNASERVLKDLARSAQNR